MNFYEDKFTGHKKSTNDDESRERTHPIYDFNEFSTRYVREKEHYSLKYSKLEYRKASFRKK